MAVKVLHDINNLPESWIAVLETAGEQEFCCGRDWFADLARTSLDAQTLPRIYGVETTDGIPLMIMVMQNPSAYAGSVLDPVYTGSVLRNNPERHGSLSSLTNFHSNQYFPFVLFLNSFFRRFQRGVGGPAGMDRHSQLP